MLDRVKVEKISHTTINKQPPAAFNFKKERYGSRVLLFTKQELFFATTYGVALYDKEVVYTDWWYDSLRKEARCTKNTYYTLPLEIVQIAAPSDAKQLGKKDYLVVEVVEDVNNRIDRERAPVKTQHISQICLSQEDFDARFKNKEAKDE